MAILKKFILVGLVWGKSLRMIRKHPKILFPFGLIAFLQFAFLTILFLAPQYPFSLVLAPPIRAFWGELYLHYPANFLLLPQLFNQGNIIISLFIGSLMTGMMVVMVNHADKNIFPGRRSSFKSSIKKYLTLVTVWIAAFILVSIVFKVPSFLILKYYFHKTGFLAQWNVLRMAFVASILIGLLIEMFFAYAVPAVMLENKNPFRAIGRSLSITKNLFLPTFVLVAIPVSLVFLITVLKSKTPELMKLFFPEITLYVLGISIAASFLINCLVTTSATILFLMNKEIEAKESVSLEGGDE